MSENEIKSTPAAAAADDENHIIAERRANKANTDYKPRLHGLIQTVLDRYAEL